MRLFRPRALARVALLGAFVVATACDNTTEPTNPSSIVAVGSQTVTGRAGDAVQVTVRVLNSNGNPLSGQGVTFTPTTGTANPSTVSTDANGQATTTWTLGTAVGTQTLNATVAGVTPITFSATVSPGKPASITVQAGNNQSAAVGTAVTTAPSVLVKDAAGNPVQGISVVFTVASGGGSVTNAVATTNAQGIATVGSFTLGSTAGANTLTAQVVDPTLTSPLTTSFTATGTAGAASRVTAQRGTNISGVAGVALGATNLPQVLVTDANNNPVAGAQVTFTVTSGGGTVTGATQTTNAQGIATLGGLTLGQTVGPNIITANVQGVGSTVFTIAGTAGAPATVTIQSGNNQSVPAGSPLTAAPSVLVRDQFGNPVSGVTVTFVPTSGNGSVLGGTQTTNAQGIAAAGGFTVGATPGTNTFEARVAGLPPAVFTATGQAGAPATITKVTPDTVVVTAFSQSGPFTVLVRDAAGFPVQGQTVTFAIDSAKAGTLTATSVQTNAQGQASVRLDAGAVIDTAVVTANVGNLNAVVFIAVVQQNVPTIVREVQGNGQSATAGTMVGINPTVEVRDANGRPVAGVLVNFQVNPGNQGAGLLPLSNDVIPINNGFSVPTDVNGRAAVGWQLGGAPGQNILNATVSAPSITNNPIVFTATGTAIPTSAVVTIFAGDAQTAPAGTLVPTQPAVLVKNAAGQPLAGVTVQFIPNGNGTVSNPTAQTDANGIARISWRLSTQPGPNSLSASVVGLGVGVVFNAIGQ
ncbi:Ig domain protein group 1 domain protein [Gemmatirosa kalamazoonensis]|uniref:Ig domain protein group 1 domain protein n=1 Tax=Gemmatirosa kalamazoonensis TaxID=861299 RepID=W0RI53_9BACT|nr:Ig-like domain-containing protein [Gemmatirosa kalamazoonensis]AHG90461.1 Ig domain protein group 1 domain protein [Gemmatirosa kalamazoonensis]